MKDELTRVAVLKLIEAGNSIRVTAKALNISKNTVKKILTSKTAEMPLVQKTSGLSPYEGRIRELYSLCRENMVRVQEELEKEGISTAYTTLTDFCRKTGLTVKEKIRAGEYNFDPGEEMQHDTSPHKAEIGGKIITVQTASLILCYSRMIFVQAYERFDRFAVRCFLTEALRYFNGSAKTCVIDNCTVIISRGTGYNAVPAPEMESFSKHFGFVFKAHALGHKNRSGKVERPMHYIENNFFAGRVFKDMAHLNKEAYKWCETVNGKYKRCILCRPADLFQTEKNSLVPLPLFIPEPYCLYLRTVTVEGYVCIKTNRYSVPDKYIGMKVNIRETKDRIYILDCGRIVTVHEKVYGSNRRVTLKEHRKKCSFGGTKKQASSEEEMLRKSSPVIAELIKKIKEKCGSKMTVPIRKLYSLYMDYPSDVLCSSIEKALKYGLYDLERIEKMVLKNLYGNYFNEGDRYD